MARAVTIARVAATFSGLVQRWRGSSYATEQDIDVNLVANLPGKKEKGRLERFVQ